MDDWDALLRLVKARLEVLKDFGSALELCQRIKNSSKSTAFYPQVLYMEGLSRAGLARAARDAGRLNTARDLMKDTFKPWRELSDKHAQSPWAAEAQFQEVLLRFDVEGVVDTVATTTPERGTQTAAPKATTSRRFERGAGVETTACATRRRLRSPREVNTNRRSKPSVK